MQNATKLKNLIIPLVKQEMGERYSYSVGPKLLHTWSYEVSKKHFSGKILCAYQSVHYNVKQPIQIQPSGSKGASDHEAALHDSLASSLKVCHKCETRDCELVKLKQENSKLVKDLEATRYALNMALEGNYLNQNAFQHQLAMSNMMHAGVLPALPVFPAQQHLLDSPGASKKRTHHEMSSSSLNSVEDALPQHKKRKVSTSPDSSTPSTGAWPHAGVAPLIMKVLPETAYVCPDLIVQLCVANADCSKQHVALIERYPEESSKCRVEEQKSFLSLQNGVGVAFLQLASVEKGTLQIRLRAEDSQTFSSSVSIPILDTPSLPSDANDPVDFGFALTLKPQQQSSSTTSTLSSKTSFFSASTRSHHMAFSLPASSNAWNENTIISEDSAGFDL
mmetsp:Transcript_2487/g.9360  ORF Transcript_2487/g.9360 Transcript_2487/m.9360 type:complete len:392 (+) Transcript_2487:2209-3384(+)